VSSFAASIDSYHANRFRRVRELGVRPLTGEVFGFLFGCVFRDDTIGRPEPPAAACDFFDYRRALAYDFDTKLLKQVRVLVDIRLCFGLSCPRLACHVIASISCASGSCGVLISSPPRSDSLPGNR
jgi:hypothetical protein